MRMLASAIAMTLVASTLQAQEVTKDDKIIIVLTLQRPCKMWMDEARLKQLRMEMVERQRGGTMDAKMFAAMHDEAVAATFTIIGDHLLRFPDTTADGKSCPTAEGYAKELKLMK